MELGLHHALTARIISSAIEVHRHLGPGLLESVYEKAFCRELTLQRIPFVRQLAIPLYYKGELIAEHRPDVVVAEAVVVEIKSVERFDQVHLAQLLTYLAVTQLRVGLLLNFNTGMLRNGIRRVSL